MTPNFAEKVLKRFLKFVLSSTRRAVLLALVAVLAFGVAGFESLRPPPAEGEVACGTCNIFDSLYRSLQLFTLSYAPPVALDGTSAEHIPLSLRIARWLAAFVTFSTVVWLVAHDSFRGAATWMQSLFGMRRRTVLLGFGDLNQALARHMLREGDAGRADVCLTVAGESFDTADPEICNRVSVVTVPADLRDERALRKLRLHRCRRIVVACGDDGLNIEIGEAVHELLRSKARRSRRGIADWIEGLAGAPSTPPRVYVHVSNGALCRSLMQGRDLGFVRGEHLDAFSIKEIAAERVMQTAFLPETAVRGPGWDRVHLVLVGFGDLGEALLRNALADGCAAGLKPPRITIMDRDAHRAVKALKARFPRLLDDTLPPADAPQIEVVEAEAEHLDFTEGPICLPDAMTPGKTVRIGAWADAGDCPSTWMFACELDHVNLLAAQRLDEAMQRLARSPAPIYARYWSSRLTGAAETFDPLSLVRPFGAIGDLIGHLPFLEKSPDLAQYLHQSYARLQTARPEAERGYTAPWEALPKALQEANLAAARHARIKLRDLGLDWAARRAGALPQVPLLELDAKLWEVLKCTSRQKSMLARRDAGAALEPHETLLSQMAEVEHRRWMYQRALSGWRATEGSIDRLRQHTPNMGAFEDLPGDDPDWDTRLNDLAMIRATLEFCGSQKSRTRAVRHRMLQVDHGADSRPFSLADVSRVSTVVLKLHPHSEGTSGVTSLPRLDPDTQLAPLERWARTDNAISLVLELGSHASAGMHRHDGASEPVAARAFVTQLVEKTVDEAWPVDVRLRLPMDDGPKGRPK